MPGQDIGFEMRRFEALSNTIFGVAMTLLAYDIPRRQLSTDNPDWAAIWSTYELPLLALLLGFIIAGLFWFSHQRRLVYEPDGTRLAVVGNLIFLLSIVALPLSTGLYGRYPGAPDVIALFSFHLALISVLNLILWVMAAVPRRDWGGARCARLRGNRLHGCDGRSVHRAVAREIRLDRCLRLFRIRFVSRTPPRLEFCVATC